MDPAAKLDQLLASAGEDVRREHARRLEAAASAAAEAAVRPYKDLEQAIGWLAEQYPRQILLERKMASQVFQTCSVQANLFGGYVM